MDTDDLLTYVSNASTDNIKVVSNISTTTEDCLNKLMNDIRLINDSLYFSNNTTVNSYIKTINNIKKDLEELSYMTQSIKNNSVRVAEDLDLTVLVIKNNTSEDTDSRSDEL